MRVRRLVSVLSVCLAASATVVVAQPKKDPAPTKGAPAGSSAAGSAAGAPAAPGSAAGSAAPAEEAPPSDMEGTTENPDDPRFVGQQAPVTAVPEKPVRTGYPIEEVLRPITLPKNMSEVTLLAHAQVSPYAGAASLRARYGITPKVQLGLTYLIGGVYAEKDFLASMVGGTKFHAGKAVGLDLTVSLQKWLAVRVGVPVYVDPFAMGLTLGAPLKFVFGEKFAIGGMDDLVNITLNEFYPSFYQEFVNEVGAENSINRTTQSDGFVRFSAFGQYQHKPNLALFGRFGVQIDLSGGDTGTNQSFLHAGLQFSPKPFLDLGFSLGFDDLAHGGTFAPTGYLNVRI